MSTVTQALVFVLDDSSGALQVTFTPMPQPEVPEFRAPGGADETIVIDNEVLTQEGGRATPPSMISCKEAMAEQGYGAFWVDEAALSGFIRATQQAKEPTTMTIAHRRDGEFSLIVSDDLMSATLTLIPPQGGIAQGPAVIEAMQEQGIVHGILQSVLNAALAAGVCEKLVIARGEWPVEGSPGYFTSLLKSEDGADDEAQEADGDDSEEEEEEEDDRFKIIKYRDLGFLLLVNPGDHLMRRTPAVSGTGGIDIKGEPVPAAPMHDVEFNEKILGAEPSPEDPNLLIATLSGQPVVIPNGVTINPVVEVENVDLITGNINFDGTITVKGDIKAGMVLKVTGDVIVKGLVEAAEIHAGGNVSVTGGIIGHAATQASTLSTAAAVPFANARVICKGSLQALFVESAYVQAGESILIKGNARQSEMIAGQQIAVGKGSGNKIGQIVGGRTHATNLIHAAWAGTSNGAKTELQVGSDPFLSTQLAISEAAYKRKLEEIDQVIKLLAFLKQNPQKAAINGMGEKAEATRRRLLGESKALFEEQIEMKEKLTSVDKARIKCTKGIYEGVEIRISKQLWPITNDLGPGTVQLKNGIISLG
ncbi:MAG: polymerase [Herbaspirillum sp.]|nr:polymerase [Herbaspirillum sp.]